MKGAVMECHVEHPLLQCPFCKEFIKANVWDGSYNAVWNHECTTLDGHKHTAGFTTTCQSYQQGTP